MQSLNTLFTKSTLASLITLQDLSSFDPLIREHVSSPETRDNSEVLSELYQFMAKHYRNEYVYQNTLLNKLLLGKHSTKTTTALMQIPIGKSIADFILINGKARVYEIKTELDDFSRLKTQLNDYYKAFAQVCVVTSEDRAPRILTMLKGSPVGVSVLTKRNTLSLRKEPLEERGFLSHRVLFQVLRKTEYEQIILQVTGQLPQVPPVFQYRACLESFGTIEMEKLYPMVLATLKRRNSLTEEYCLGIPYSLRSLRYFSQYNQAEERRFQTFLKQRYGG
ncbi:sce7726 family protein [Sphaerochaeta sp. PS]|uniref:sce7726 family protein n=1 Tax=Sphaerochaeta sp. PS TaxID=3076336 RepID=UPI0028A4BD7B|nr:sce7726 family protein [Sphaerochaeta sp. PS]MDT4762561.1 sce7726 family protein [Sphaerochaeta sp. PS]